MLDELEPIYRYAGFPTIARAHAAEKERGSSHVDTRHLSKSNGILAPLVMPPISADISELPPHIPRQIPNPPLAASG